jgi:dipeptidyl aminopeptidase/acylaminoacyl peptidase
LIVNVPESPAPFIPHSAKPAHCNPPDRNSLQRWYICRVRTLIGVIFAMLLAGTAAAQKIISFPTQDGGVIYADNCGKGDRAIVLAHGGRFKKESWNKQALTLASAGFRVLALDFRGYGKFRGPGDSDPLSAPLELDVLAAVR